MAEEAFGVGESELRLLEQLAYRFGETEGAPIDQPSAVQVDLSQKRYATPEELRAYFLAHDHPHIQVDGETFKLLREDERDNLGPEDIERAAQERLLWDEANRRPACVTTPDSVDHRPGQTAIRNQLDRGTCVCFASLAALEALFGQEGLSLDLSEQYANWLFMRFEGRNQCDDGMKTTDSAKYLSNGGVCAESLSPYEDDATVNQHCTASPSAAAQQQARYGIQRHVLIDNLGPNGPSIANTSYLECLLSSGHDVVFGTHVAWGHPDQNDVFDIVLDPYGNPLRSRGGHAMLLVGYDRQPTTPIPYFIFKNSWGSKGAAGYYFLSYDYVRYYSKYGYVVLEPRGDVAEE